MTYIFQQNVSKSRARRRENISKQHDQIPAAHTDSCDGRIWWREHMEGEDFTKRISSLVVEKGMAQQTTRGGKQSRPAFNEQVQETRGPLQPDDTRDVRYCTQNTGYGGIYGWPCQPMLGYWMPSSKGHGYKSQGHGMPSYTQKVVIDTITDNDDRHETAFRPNLELLQFQHRRHHTDFWPTKRLQSAKTHSVSELKKTTNTLTPRQNGRNLQTTTSNAISSMKMTISSTKMIAFWLKWH